MMFGGNIGIVGGITFGHVLFWESEEGIYEWFCVCVLYTIGESLCSGSC